MTHHPSSLDLEAFACGETEDLLEPHLAECDRCSAFVERVRGALAAGPSRARADDVVARVAAQDRERASRAGEGGPRAEPQTRARDAARRRGWMKASTVAVPLAAAAALLLLLRSPSTKDALAPTAPTAERPSAPVVTGDPDPETTFKGGIQVAVIRERAGEQARFTGVVRIRPGDRLRVEVALDREQAILAAVMGDDASWVELMSEGVRRPGTHFSERSARVDASPMQGTVLVGSPEAVARARSERRFEGVSAVRVEWERSP